MKILPLVLLAALVGCRSNDDDASREAATMDVETAELPAIRYYMIADT